MRSPHATRLRQLPPSIPGHRGHVLVEFTWSPHSRHLRAQAQCSCGQHGPIVPVKWKGAFWLESHYTEAERDGT